MRTLIGRALLWLLRPAFEAWWNEQDAAMRLQLANLAVQPASDRIMEAIRRGGGFGRLARKSPANPAVPQ